MVRTTTINTPFYVPAEVPTDPAELQRYLRNEFNRIAGCVAILAKGHCEFVNVAPSKPREGDIIGCDGTNLNLGSGKGIYGYYTGAWHLLG
jgi:hypothetical protein